MNILFYDYQEQMVRRIENELAKGGWPNDKHLVWDKMRLGRSVMVQTDANRNGQDAPLRNHDKCAEHDRSKIL